MSLTRIAVGVDFSPESERALAHAMALARRLGAGVTLVHASVIPPEAPDDLWREVLAVRLAEDRARLTALRERLTGQGVEVSHVVVDSYPDIGMADAAHELGAGLIVVGTHGRTGISRVMLGSVAEKTARIAEGSVLVARGDAVPGGYRRVVVGTDDSPLAEIALQRAMQLTAPGGEVLVLHAWAAPFIEYDLGGRMLIELRATAEKLANRQRERLLALRRPEGVTLKLEIRDGTPLDVLEAASASADLVAIGTHGRRGVRRFFLGSVAETTIRHARCSVLVAR